MPSYQLLRCMVALGGDNDNTVYRDRSRPIAFPELAILQNIHGGDAITDIHVVGMWHAPNEEVLLRLQVLYGEEAVKEVYPGVRPKLPQGDGAIPRCTLPVYKPRSPKPDSPDPKLRSLDQFTRDEARQIEAPPLPEEDEPTADEIAAHVQEDPDEDQSLYQPDPQDED